MNASLTEKTGSGTAGFFCQGTRKTVDCNKGSGGEKMVYKGREE